MGNKLNTITIQIAGVSVEIASKYAFSPSIYVDFRTNSPGKCRVELVDDDLDLSIRHFSGTKREAIGIKTPAILRKVATSLVPYDVILIHGAVLSYNRAGYLFTAPSATGKTTHCELWMAHLFDATIVNGDKPFIKFPEDGGTPLACGSPWAGKENMYTNTMVPLKSIILMERAEKMRKTLRLMQRLNGPVSFWRFQCNNFKDDCFDVAYNALVGEQK